MSLISFDSLDKIKHYMVMLALEPDGDIHPPKKLYISKTFWRDYTCPPGCGGCCKSFSMDLWPEEFEVVKEHYPEKSKEFSKYIFKFFGIEQEIFSNREAALERFNKPVVDYLGRKCMFLDGIGRCGIYLGRPFSCRFELNKINFDKKRSSAIIGKRLFGRGWSYKRMDGEVGALCEMIPLSDNVVDIVYKRDIPLFYRLVELLNLYKVEHRGDIVLEILENQYEILKNGGNILDMTPVLLLKKSLF